MKVIDNKKYIEVENLINLIKEHSFKDEWGVSSLYVDRFIQDYLMEEKEDSFIDVDCLDYNEKYLFSNTQNGMTKEDRRLLDSNFRTLNETINKLIQNQKTIIDKLNNLIKE